jgi:hypothetical protein
MDAKSTCYCWHELGKEIALCFAPVNRCRDNIPSITLLLHPGEDARKKSNSKREKF